MALRGYRTVIFDKFESFIVIFFWLNYVQNIIIHHI